MPSFTVTTVDTKVRDWNSEAGGTMRAYKMAVQGADGTLHNSVEWSRKLSSPPPEVGQMLEGEIIQGQYGARFKKAQGGGYGRQAEDPKRQASIIRQHSQTAALTVLTLKQQLGVLTPDDLTPTKIQQLADFFDDDVRHGVQRSEKTA